MKNTLNCHRRQSLRSAHPNLGVRYELSRLLGSFARAAGIAAIGISLFAAGIMAQTAGTAGAIRVAGLRADAMSEPLGIDNPRPRLSWRIEADRPAVQQTAFRVLVGTTSAAAASGKGPEVTWDSGVVRSSNPFVLYAGPPLASRTRYYWSVRVWVAGDPEGTSYVSKPGWFETAYMDPAEWRGEWIGGPKRLERPPTVAESLQHDACCLPYTSALYEPAAAGATNLKVESVAAVAPGSKLVVGGQTVEVTKVGTAAVRTAVRAGTDPGANNVKVASVEGFAAGQPVLIGNHRATIRTVGTPAMRFTLAAAAEAGATSIRIAAAAGPGRGGGGGGGQAATAARSLQPGDPIVVGDETRTIASVSLPQPQQGPGPGGQGPGGGGGPGRGGQAAAITVMLKPSLAAAHPQGTAVEALGSGITFEPPLTAAIPAGAPVSTPGSGLDVTPALRAALAAGTPIRSEEPKEFCRPKGGRGTTGSCREIRPVPMLRKAFTVEPVAKRGKVVAARAYSVGLAWNDLRLNGTRTSDRYLDPVFTNYYDTVYYRAEDVTALIRQQQNEPAENVVAVQLGSGRFDQESVTVNWAYETAEWRQTPRLRMDLYIRYADGSEQIIKSDGSWKVSVDGPIRYDGFYLGETYDARREIPGWDRPGFNDSSWMNARLVEAPKGRLMAQRGDPTRLIANWPPGKQYSPKPGVLVWDTGQLRSGWATVRVHGAKPGTAIQIAYSDKTAADGTISAGPGEMQVDYYIAKGTGTAANPEVYTPQFTYKGFQYIQISAPVNLSAAPGGTGGMGGGQNVPPEPLPPGVNVEVASVQEVRTAMPETGKFAASQPLLERIERAMRASLAANYVSGIITDTPQYEKNGWTGDAQLTVPVAALQFDAERQFWKSVQDMVDAQTPQGEVTLLAPTARGYGHTGHVFKRADCCGATPIWDAFWFVIPWEAYLRYGDIRFLEHTFPLMKKYLDEWIPRWTDKDGDSFQYTLTSGLGDWAPVTGADAPEGSPTRFRVLPVTHPVTTAYYTYLTKIAADTARALGNANDAYRYDVLFENIKNDFNARWWDESVGFYREDSSQPFFQTLAIVPLAFNLVPEEKRRSLQEKLIADIMKTRAGHAMVGIVGMRWILPVLTQAAEEGVPGALEAAYTIMTQTTYPSYGYWISLGWTALGEYWERTSRTRSHHMYGSGVQWLYEHLAGIQPLEPGYRKIAFVPSFPAGLDHAEASYDSVRGTIRSSWRRQGSTLTLEVTVPPTSTGVVYLPASGPAAVKVDSERHATFAGKQGSRLAYQVDSGTYRFVVSGK